MKLVQETLKELVTLLATKGRISPFRRGQLLKSLRGALEGLDEPEDR